MLIKGSHVIGSKVITVKEGKEVEDVDDIIYDPLDNRVKALLVDGGGLFTDATVILLEETQSIGEDIVLIDSERALKHASDVSPSVSNIAKGNTYLTQKRIVTEDGKQLGVITDIYFDPKTGKVEEFEVSQGLEDMRSGRKRIKITDVVTVGKDATIVREYATEEFQRQAQSQGISGAVTQGVAKVQTQTEEIRDKARQQLKKDAVGKYVTKNILLPSDKILIRRGEIVTYRVINEAEQDGILDQILRNLSTDPVKSR